MSPGSRRVTRRPRPTIPAQRWLAAGVVAFSIVLAACDPSAQPAAVASTVTPGPTASNTVPRGDTLRWAVAAPASIEPTSVVDDAGLLVVDSVFDSLTRVEPDGRVRPSAAARWRPRDNGRRWRFWLRPGARYHDGTPVRAQDVAAAWALTVRRGVTGSHLQDVEGYRAVREGRALTLAGVRVVDRRTLDVVMRRPTMALPAIVAHPSLAPVPPVALTDRGAFAGQPIGNGPYRITERWRGGQFIRVERDARWRNGAQEQSDARVREIVFRILDRDAAYVAFQQGRVDVTRLPGGALRQALRTYGAAVDGTGPGVIDVPLPSLYFLGLRVDTAPWDDPAARRALSRAIDRRSLVDARGDLALDPARWIVPPALSTGRGSEVCETCLHLPSLARAAFAAAGVSEVTLTIDAGGGHDRVARRIRADLQRVGVDVTMRELPFDEYLDAVEAGDLTLYRFGWQAQYPSPAAMLEPLVRSGAPAERGDGANYGGYADDTVDRLLDRARTARSEARRRALWVRAEDRALEDQAIIPLFSFRERTVVSARVRGLQITPWGTATPEQASIVSEPDISS